MENKDDATLNLRGEILRVLRETPGLTTVELSERLPQYTRTNVQVTAYNLKTQRRIVVAGKKHAKQANGRTMPIATYKIAAEGPPRAKTKNQISSVSDTHALLKQLAELETWKADALRRYPDLAVSPTVVAARELLAAEAQYIGDNELIEGIMRGDHDASLAMRVAIRAAEAVA